MRNAIIFLLMTCFTVNAHGQVRKHTKKSRRYKSESQFALKKHEFQAEWEVGRETIDSQLTTNVYPNLLLHYVLSDRLEVNTEMSLITVSDKSYNPKRNTTGIEPFLVGSSYQVLRDTHNSPSLILSAQFAIPFLATKDFSIEHLAPVFQVDLQEAVHKKWIVGWSGGVLWDGYSTTPTYTYNATSSYSFTKKWMITAECFGFISNSHPQNNLDASLAYVVNDLIQFGITAGAGISTAAPKNYFAVNGSWGINTSRHRPAR